MRHKKGPESVTADSEAKHSGECMKKSTQNLAKYARLKRINCQIGATLENWDSSLSRKVLGCGRYLLFREFVESGTISLACGNYCNAHLMCPCCSAARSRRLLAKWLPIVFSSRNQNLRHYMLTLTWPPPREPECGSTGHAAGHEEDNQLKRNLAIGMSAWGKLWNRKRKRLTGPFKAVLGAIVATEVTKGPAGWHPHFHVLISMRRTQRVDVNELREEWCKLTGGRQIRLDVLKTDSDVVEVFKYAVKPVDVDSSGRILEGAVQVRHQIYESLRGARLIRGYGIYFNCVEPDLEQAEEIEDLGDWVDLIFKWMGDNYALVETVPNSALKGVI